MLQYVITMLTKESLTLCHEMSPWEMPTLAGLSSTLHVSAKSYIFYEGPITKTIIYYLIGTFSLP
jgi:hypothetical protein